MSKIHPNLQGKVTRFIDQRFGFISGITAVEQPAGINGHVGQVPAEVFLHSRAIPTGTQVREGTSIRFDVQPDTTGKHPGKLEAINVSVAAES